MDYTSTFVSSKSVSHIFKILFETGDINILSLVVSFLVDMFNSKSTIVVPEQSVKYVYSNKKGNRPISLTSFWSRTCYFTPWSFIMIVDFEHVIQADIVKIFFIVFIK